MRIAKWYENMRIANVNESLTRNHETWLKIPNKRRKMLQFQYSQRALKKRASISVTNDKKNSGFLERHDTTTPTPPTPQQTRTEEPPSHLLSHRHLCFHSLAADVPAISNPLPPWRIHKSSKWFRKWTLFCPLTRLSSNMVRQQRKIWAVPVATLG